MTFRRTLLVSMAAFFLGAASPTSPKVETFTPQGVVPGVRQARAAFSEPMIAFGDPRGPAPFDLQCPEKGSGRWADQRNWIFDFERDIPAGVRCVFKLKTGLKSLAGQELGEPREFWFSTGGPSITGTTPYQGSQVREDQAFILKMGAPVTEASVLKNAYFQAEGTDERIPVKLIGGKERELILEQQYEFSSRYNRDKQALVAAREKAVVLQARRTFGSGKKLAFVWDKGVATPGGVETTEAQTFQFTVRKEFTATFSCERENANAGCLPFTSMTLQFSSPVSWAKAESIRLKGAPNDGKPEKPSSSERDAEATVYAVSFKGPFSESTHYKLDLPWFFRDDDGRKLENADKFPLEVTTGTYPPLAKFPTGFGIIESKPEPVLPVTVRNIEADIPAAQGRIEGKVLSAGKMAIPELAEWLYRTSDSREWDRREHSILSGRAGSARLATEALKLPRPNGAKSFEVMGIPLKKPGFYVVELESAILGKALLGKERPMYVATSALVTNLSVHFKRGRENSLVWVTSLDTGKPVTGASVHVYDCAGTVSASGKSDENGIARLAVELPESARSCPVTESGKKYPRYSQYDGGWFVTAEKEGDFSFVHSSWDRGIERFRYNFPSASNHVPELAHVVLDRPLFRAGETVHMKHFMRRHGVPGFEPFKKADLPRTVQLRHSGSNQSFEFPLDWDSAGTSLSEWNIPKGAKLGTYQVRYLKRGPKAPPKGEDDSESEESHSRYSGDYDAWEAGSFRVEEYRVPLMKGRIITPKSKLVMPKSLAVDLSAEYLAGGGASKLPVTVRYRQEAKGAERFSSFEDWDFAKGIVKLAESRRGSAAPDESEIDGEGEADSAVESDGAGKPANIKNQLSKRLVTLDRTGAAHLTIDQLKPIETPSSLELEMEFRDPNGELQTVTNRVALYPASRLVGVKTDGWSATRKSLKFKAAVVDLEGKAVVGAPVEVELIEEKTFSHRKKLIGGFYAYENHSELKKHGRVCVGKTDDHGLLACDIKSPVTGQVHLQAKTSDPLGHVAVSYTTSSVYSEEGWWFSQEDHDRMDVLPERKRYEPGETAQFQVRMPFREALALVTVEREGTLDAFTTSLSSKHPVVSVPLKGNYAPNVYVSVLAVRGRSGDVQPTALVDLGRPAYKLGVAEVEVSWGAHELKVDVKPEREVYRIREKAKVHLTVRGPGGKPPGKQAEVALAAVDEGLLQLSPNESWDLLGAMMGRRPYEVETSTAQGMVVGKRHFGLKARPAGGDGGKSPTRELFDTLLIWKGRVALDDNGEADVEIPLNDSITSFRIAAVASAETGLFGTGYAKLRSTQELMVLPGVAPLAREGDQLPAAFTLRNASADPLKVEVTAHLPGALGTEAKVEKREVALGPNESRILSYAMDIPFGVESLKYEIQARALDQVDKPGIEDHVKFTQKVVPATPIRTFQATLTQIEKLFTLSLAMPKNAVAGLGGVRLALQPTLLAGLAGVREYMTAYPYTCLEQKTSRAVALRDEKLWEKVTEELPSYLDSNGLARYFPSDRLEGSDVLTAYVLSITDEAGWKIPAASLAHMTAGLQAFVEGRIKREGFFAESDLTVRKIAAIEALSRRGSATPQMLGSIEIRPDLWATSAVIDWHAILLRMKEIPDQPKRLQAARQILLSRLNFQGTEMSFSTDKTDFLWWLMVSPDENANRLLITALDSPDWPSRKDDVPRMAKGAMLRHRRGAWMTTTANAWGVLAAEKFAHEFEREQVGGTTSAELATSRAEFDWSKKKEGGALDLAWPGAQGGEPGARGDLKVVHEGSGKPWVVVQSRAAIPLKEPFSSGYRIKKTYAAVDSRTKGAWSKGDIIRVHLEIDAQADMSWVVLTDPVPAGASILGSGLGGDSALATQGTKNTGWVDPAYEERAFEGYRAYYAWVPKGKFTQEYTIRLNQGGVLGLPPTRVEAMYAPESFGEFPNPITRIAE